MDSEDTATSDDDDDVDDEFWDEEEDKEPESDSVDEPEKRLDSTERFELDESAESKSWVFERLRFSLKKRMDDTGIWPSSDICFSAIPFSTIFYY